MTPLEWFFGLCSFIGLCLAVYVFLGKYPTSMNIFFIGIFLIFLAIFLFDLKKRRRSRRLDKLELIDRKLSSARTELEEEKNKIIEITNFILSYFSPQWECISGQYFIPNYFSYVIGEAKLLDLANQTSFPDVPCKDFVLHQGKVDIYSFDWPLRRNHIFSISNYFFQQGCRIYKICDKGGFEIFDAFDISLRECSPCSITIVALDNILENKQEEFIKLFRTLPMSKDGWKPKFEELWCAILDGKIILSENDCARIALVNNYLGFSFTEDYKKKMKKYLEDKEKIRNAEDILFKLNIGIYFYALCFIVTHYESLNLFVLYILMSIRLNRIINTLDMIKKPITDIPNVLINEQLPIQSIPLDLVDAIELAKE